MSLKQGIKDAIKSMPAESRNQMLEALSTLRGYQDFQQKAFRELPPPPRIDVGQDDPDTTEKEPKV